MAKDPETPAPELTSEAEEAGHDPTKVSAPTLEQIKEGVIGV